MFWAVLVAALAMPQSEPVVAWVGGEPITVTEVSARAKAAGVPPLDALEGVIREVVLAQAARAEGLASRPEVKEQLESERRRLGVQRLLEKEVYPRIEVSAAEVAALFHARSDQVRLSMVVHDTLDEASRVLARLQRGESLVEEGKKSSDPLIASKSGVLGWVRREELAPELARAAFEARLLVLTGPVAVPKGYAVILVHERKVGNGALIGAEEEQLRRTLALSKHDGSIARFVRDLRRKRNARIDTAFLARTGERVAASARELDHPVGRAGKLVVRYAELVGPLSEAAGNGHGASGRAPPEMKERLAWQLLDRKLLEGEAVLRGFDRGAEVMRTLERVERNVLVRAYLRSLGARAQGAAAGARQARDGIDARLAELREKARVRVDESVLGELIEERG